MQIAVFFLSELRDERVCPEFAWEIWVESSLAGEMSVITRWHWEMNRLWSYTLLRQSLATAGRHIIFHKWAPDLAGGWQACWPCEDLGKLEVRLKARTVLAKPEDSPAASYCLSLPCAQCQQTVSFWVWGRRLGSKLAVCLFHHNFSHWVGQERLIQTKWLLLFPTFSILSFLFFVPSLSSWLVL